MSEGPVGDHMLGTRYRHTEMQIQITDTDTDTDTDIDIDGIENLKLGALDTLKAQKLSFDKATDGNTDQATHG